MAGECSVVQERSYIEVKFPSRPSAAYRNQLKAAGYKWDGKRTLWRACYSRDNLAVAKKATEPAPGVEREDCGR